MREPWQHVLMTHPTETVDPLDAMIGELVSDYRTDSIHCLQTVDDYAMRDAFLSDVDEAREFADGDESVYSDPRSILRCGNPLFDRES